MVLKKLHASVSILWRTYKGRIRHTRFPTTGSATYIHMYTLVREPASLHISLLGRRKWDSYPYIRSTRNTGASVCRAADSWLVQRIGMLE